jgi:hypothetical protein
MMTGGESSRNGRRLDTLRRSSPSFRMAMNTEWHQAHPMPHKATLAQRVSWHRLHAENCNCRPMPPDIMIEIDRLERSKNKKTYRPR